MKRITPTCCDKVQKAKSVYMALEDSYNTDSPPAWYVLAIDPETELHKRVKVEFCPHCSRSLPPIVPNPNAHELKICSIKDGGYYCDTCKKRLMSCSCHPPVFKWRAVDNTPEVKWTTKEVKHG